MGKTIVTKLTNIVPYYNMEKIYEQIIENEKELNKLFLNSIQVYEERFIEENYLFLKPIIANQYFIKKIFETIDDLIITEKLETKIRFLIITDFLFALTSSNIKDPSRMVFKINRNEYLKNIRLRSSINTIFGYNYITYIKIHKKLLIGLRINKILSKKEIRSLKNRVWITNIYFKLELENHNILSNININYSNRPFIIYPINQIEYLIGTFRNILQLKRKKKEMVDFPINNKSIIKSNQIGLILCEDLYTINKNNLQEEEARLLKIVNCKNLEEYFVKLKKIIDDDNYINLLLIAEKKTENPQYMDILILKQEINVEYIQILKEFNKILNFLVLKENIFNKIIYLPCFADNRNRKYYGTLISPTFYKIFRYLYKFEKKIDIKNLESSTYFKKIIKYKNKVKIFNLDSTNEYLLIVLLIEIGKHFIKTTQEEFVKTETIIELGLKYYLKRETKLEFEDKLYTEKIYNIISNLIEKRKIDLNTIIYKDATASGIQNYGILLGYKEEMLKYINLNGEDWCDTYQYLINIFLENKNFINKRLDKRKYWKSTIMTIPYNARWFSCFIKFLDEIQKDGINYNHLEEKEKNEIKNIHKNFYNSIKEKLKEKFYQNKEGELKIFSYNKWVVVDKKEYKINYKKTRDKYIDILYILTEDLESTERALEANNMHYLDAQLVDYILNKFDILAIHDCFGIKLSELHLIMDSINEYYSIQINKKTYSIHIII